jgi:hypothetical protein
MDISITINVPFFGLTLRAEIDGTYSHDTFEPLSVFLYQLADTTDEAGPVRLKISMFLPTAADVSDFYSAHGTAIDEAVSAELADRAEAAAEADDYEAQRQDEIDDNAERALG